MLGGRGTIRPLTVRFASKMGAQLLGVYRWVVFGLMGYVRGADLLAARAYLLHFGERRKNETDVRGPRARSAA